MDKVEKAVIDNEGVWPFDPDDDCILRQKSTGNLCGGRESFYCDAIYDLFCTKDEYCTKVVCMISDGWSPSSQNINHEHQDHKEGEGVNDDWLTSTIDGLPPAGTQCMASWLVPPDGGAMEPIDVRIVAYDVLKDKVWLATSYGDELVRTCDACFYPRVSHRDKCIEAAQKIVSDMRCWQCSRQDLEVLYDGGALKLPGEEE